MMSGTNEPSLSSDTRSMLHDEHSQRLDALKEMIMDIGNQADINRQNIARHQQCIETQGKSLEQVFTEFDGLKQRVAAQQTDIAEVGFGVIVLEKRVADLEQKLETLEYQAYEPLHKEELD